MSLDRSWASLSWPDLQQALDPGGGRPHVGLVPVGAIEQHGPHLPVGTDTIVANALCDRAAEISESIVLPAISLGVSYGHGVTLPGTLSLSPQLLIAVVQQYARWSAMSGLGRLLFVNAHFGNAASLGVATDEIRLMAPDLRVGVLDWWALTPAITSEVLADGNDIHANRAETSLMLAIAPDLVNTDRMMAADDPDRSDGKVFRYTAALLSTNGVTGRPSQGDAALGRRLFEDAAAAIAAAVITGRSEEPPLGTASTPEFPF